MFEAGSVDKVQDQDVRLTEFLNDLCRGKLHEIEPQCERRSAPRYTVSVPVAACPLNKNLRPSGKELQGTTRDISQNGVGLVLTQPIEAKYLRLTLQSQSRQTYQLVIEVKHHQPLDAERFLVGGRIISGFEG